MNVVINYIDNIIVVIVILLLSEISRFQRVFLISEKNIWQISFFGGGCVWKKISNLNLFFFNKTCTALAPV